MNEVCGVYKITCVPTGDFYVGSSIHVQQRYFQHRAMMGAGRASRSLCALYEAYGRDSFRMDVLEECTVHELEAKEAHYMDILRPTLNQHRVKTGARQKQNRLGLTVTVPITMPKTTLAPLDNMAHDLKRSRNSLIREAIEALCIRYEVYRERMPTGPEAAAREDSNGSK